MLVQEFGLNVLLTTVLLGLISTVNSQTSTTSLPKDQSQDVGKNSLQQTGFTKKNSNSSGNKNEHVVYVSNTPKAPKFFLSTTLKPDVTLLESTTTKKPVSSSTAMPTGMSKKLKGSGVKSKKPIKTLMENSICGRVPIFEKAYHQSINETFKIKTEDEDDDGEGEFRILHGIDAIKGEWPWIVKIEVCSHGGRCGSCTGSLINSRWVVTAGHCGTGEVELYKGQFGLYDLIINENSVVNVTFDKMIVHPEFKKDTLDNDLTLLRLSKAMKFNDYIQPICLIDAPHKDSVKFTKNRKCYNVGYGLTIDMTAALKLQKIEVEAKSPEECNDSDMFAVHLRKNNVCIGPREGQIGASCKGDSGGPNACYDPHTNQWYLFSTVSFGPHECDREEGDKWLTVSVELAKYINWIRSAIQQNS